METTYKSTLEINKLTQAQFNTAKTNNTLDANALYLTPEQPVTFTSSGGASAGTTYDGSAAVTVSYATVGAASSGHNHTSKITLSSATSAGTASSISLSHGTSYKLWTGSASAFTFTMPSTPTHTCSIATDSTSTTPVALVHGGRYKLTAGGSSVIFTMPSAPTDNDTKCAYTSVPSYESEYPLLAKSSTSTTTTAGQPYFVTSVTLTPKAGQIKATTFYATSDKRLKENIKPFNPKKSILELPVVEFDFKNSGVHQIGCLAQDLQEICPEIVSKGDDGYLSINESKIVYLLLDEVKKLKAEVEDLKAKV
jgi:hypothetical protein